MRQEAGVYTFTDPMGNAVTIKPITGKRFTIASTAFKRNQNPTYVAIPEDELPNLLEYLFALKYNADIGEAVGTEQGEEVYYVVSNGDEPHRILFNLKDAVLDGSRFIDAFDKDGNLIRGYSLDENNEYTYGYRDNDNEYHEVKLSDL